MIDSLPNEVLRQIVRQLDNKTLDHSISQIPVLRKLSTLKITDNDEIMVNEDTSDVDVITIQSIINHKLSLDSIFKQYHFYQIEIHNFSKDESIYMRFHKLLARLIRLKKIISIKYLGAEIDMNYLKMFKSLFNNHIDPSSTHPVSWFDITFENLKQVKSNCNHLLISPNVSYPFLESLNLYYCSPKFYFEILNYLDLQKFPSTFPNVTYLKLQDYMNEEEDIYSQHSNNYIKSRDDDDDGENFDDYDDYDNNSDLDENEFYFDGLEIIQNYNLSKLQVLIIKNCNVSKIKKIYAPNLDTFKIFELSNKHIDAYDLNLIDSSNIVKRSFISSAVSTSCCLQQNNFPNLRTLKIIGHLKLTDFSKNILDLDEIQQIIIKGCNVEIIDKDSFWDSYHGNNQIALEVL